SPDEVGLFMRCRLLSRIFLLLLVLTAGCSKGGPRENAEDVKVDFSLKPEPPKVGKASVTVKLSDSDGKPLTGATLKLEGNMNHAGMKPVFADPKEVDPGRYEANLELTMGGDWFVLIQGTLADG